MINNFLKPDKEEQSTTLSITDLQDLLKHDIIPLTLAPKTFRNTDFPVAWWAMNKWLQSFAYRINISWWTFIVAGFVALLIALITVSFQAIKAAIANPVKSLRTE